MDNTAIYNNHCKKMSVKKGDIIRQLPYIIEPVPEEASLSSPKLCMARSMNVTMAASSSSNSPTRFVGIFVSL